MTAQEWYKTFLRQYGKDNALQKLESKLEKGPYPTESSDWTKAMKKFLVRMAKSKGFEVEEESRVVGGKRADQRWLKGNGSIVAIEHENVDDKNLSGEINKLCNDVSELKVLITYVSDNEFKRKVRKLNDKVRQSIESHIDTFTGEFLLVVSGWYREPKDESWKAYRSVLTPKFKQIV